MKANRTVSTKMATDECKPDIVNKQITVPAGEYMHTKYYMIITELIINTSKDKNVCG